MWHLRALRIADAGWTWRMASGFLNGVPVVVEQKFRGRVGDCEESMFCYN
jgi:hypothetical protein